MKEVFEFDPVIYPRKLWIVISDKTKFEGFRELPEVLESSMAETVDAYKTSSNEGGVMIRFVKDDYLISETIAHEAVHAAFAIYDYIGAVATIENQECFCYLVGWIAKCCDEVKHQIYPF